MIQSTISSATALRQLLAHPATRTVDSRNGSARIGAETVLVNPEQTGKRARRSKHILLGDVPRPLLN